MTLTVPGGTYLLSGNPVYVEVAGGNPPQGSSHYRLLLKVTSVDGDLRGAPFVDAIAPDVQGKALFDISGWVDQPPRRSFSWPLSGGINPFGESVYDIQLTPGQMYIDDQGNLQESWGAASDSYFVLKGGLPPQVLAGFNARGTSFDQQYVQGGKFLTLQPDNLVVSPLQPVKLWIVSSITTECEFRTRAYWEDGSWWEDAKPGHVLYRSIYHEVECYPPHNDHLNLPMVKANGARMTHYQSWFEGLSEVRTFVVDHRVCQSNNYLFFVNRLGGIDCLWLSGGVQTGHRTSQVLASRPLIRGFDAWDRGIVASKATQPTWSINSGYKRPAEMAALVDLLGSNQVWLLEGTGPLSDARPLPVTITNSQDVLTTWDGDNLQEVTLELALAY